MLGRSHRCVLAWAVGASYSADAVGADRELWPRLQGGIRQDMTDVNDGNLEVIVASPRRPSE